MSENETTTIVVLSLVKGVITSLNQLVLNVIKLVKILKKQNKR